MKFVMSYSCGKDSTLALHKMVEQGHTPVGLLVMINRDQERSWFHGVDEPLLTEIADALSLPLIECPSSGEEYHLALEEGLRHAQKLGAELCAFGDIDVEENAAWSRARCDAVGMRYAFPLWQMDREQVLMEFLGLGYQAVVKCVRNGVLSKELLGKTLDQQMLSVLRESGADICGENGEYHTLVVDGPLFRHPVRYQTKQVLDFGNISAINIEFHGDQAP